MFKLLVFTDIHITEPGETIIGLSPRARFEAALAHALARHPDAEQIVITGDLTHHGKVSEYEELREILQGCPIPVRATLGNHDHRSSFFEVFPKAARDDKGFAQSAFDVGQWRVLVLDTLDEDKIAPRHAGYLCEARLNWLDQQLAQASDRPVLICAHHPPFDVGFDGMDEIKLVNGDVLLSRLQSPMPRHIICGHVHRTISGMAEGVGYSMLKSPCHQAPMHLGPSPSSGSVDEPGAYGIVLIHDAGVIIHSEDYALSTGESFDDLGSV